MSSQTQIQVLSIGSSAEGRQTLSDHLSQMSGVNNAGDAGSASETLDKLQNNHIDVVLLDLGANGIDSIALIKQIRISHPTVRILVFTGSDTPEDIFNSMDAGADAYVLRRNLKSALEPAICSTRLGAVWLDPDIARQVLQVMETAPIMSSSRILPTGFMPMPLRPDEQSILNEVAGSSCTDGVCMVDPNFIRKLKRFSTAEHAKD